MSISSVAMLVLGAMIIVRSMTFLSCRTLPGQS